VYYIAIDNANDKTFTMRMSFKAFHILLKRINYLEEKNIYELMK